MTKADVIKEVSERTGIAQSDVLEMFESSLEVMKDCMAKGQSIYIRGFGTFTNKKRARKVARNIKENTTMIIEPHYIPGFRPSRILATHVRKAMGKPKE